MTITLGTGRPHGLPVLRADCRVVGQAFTCMEDLEFLDTYEGQTLEEILALKSTHRADSLVMAVGVALMEKGKAVDWALEEPEWVVLAVEAVEREVTSGGFVQFFKSSARAFAGIADSAFDAIGCPGFAAVTRDAVAALGLPDEFSVEDVSAALEERPEEISEVLEECDNCFFETEERLAECLLDFIEAHKDQIAIPYQA